MKLDNIHEERALGIILGVSVLVLLMASNSSALSNDGGGSWAYFKEITISNAGNTLTDYQSLISLDSSSFPTNAQINGADIRFTDADGNELSYWIESWDYSGRRAKIWVNVTSIPTSGNVKIRMYYGNPNATSASNGDTTFELFDDFSGTQVNAEKWNVHGSPSIDSGWLHASVGDNLLSRNSFAGPYILEIRYKKITMPEGIGDAYSIYYDNTGNGLDSYSYHFNSYGNHWREVEDVDGGYYWSYDSPISEQVQTLYNLKIYSDGVVFRTYRNDSLIYSSVLTNYFATRGKIKLGVYESGESLFDDVRIRKYASPEPMVSLGAPLPPAPAPELPTIALMGIGMLGLSFVFKKKK